MSSLNNPNSFTPSDDWPTRPNGARPTERSLARMLAPIRARLECNDQVVHSLELEPMNAGGCARPWIEANPCAGSTNLVIDLEQGDRLTTLVAAQRIAADPVGGGFVMDDLALGALLSVAVRASLAVVRIDGPIEASDARAISQGLAAGRSPRDVELRTVATLIMRANRVTCVESESRSLATAFIAERLARYIGDVGGIPERGIARPDVDLVETLLARGGSLRVRPIETEVYSTAIDIGVGTDVAGPGPADASLIYDLYANTWHGE